MTTVIELEAGCSFREHVPTDGLFQVWIDLNAGQGEADWWWNTPPKPISDALNESAQVRASGWVCKVIPEGQNPRADGRWDNP